MNSNFWRPSLAAGTPTQRPPRGFHLITTAVVKRLFLSELYSRGSINLDTGKIAYTK